ncbi:MAG: nitroreductase family protein [Alistipes finegoldii]
MNAKIPRRGINRCCASGPYWRTRLPCHCPISGWEGLCPNFICLAGDRAERFIIICSTVAEDRYVDIDLGISAQSMLLQAVEIGLNGICIGAFDKEPIRRSSTDAEPLLILALGKGIEKIELTEIGSGGDRAYYRKNGTHYVPKVRLEDLLIG